MRIKKVNELVGHYGKALADGRFSRGEKRVISQLLEDFDFDPGELNLLRNKLFKLAKSHVSGGRAHDAIDWLENANKTLPAASPVSASATSKVFFSPGTDCLNAISSLLKLAKTSVDICVFTITDNRITDVIRQRHRDGVRVRIISDNDKAFDAGSDIHALVRAGLEVRTDDTADHMHHKFALIDGNTALTGSYNWTRSAADDNLENLLVTDEVAIVRSFKREFERLWGIMKKHR